jgi:hypothetical protein
MQALRRGRETRTDSRGTEAQRKIDVLEIGKDAWVKTTYSAKRVKLH